MFKVSGTVFVVTYRHYMGMDGDYYMPICIYTTKEAAENKVKRLNRDPTLPNEEYDRAYYCLEEVELII